MVVLPFIFQDKLFGLTTVITYSYLSYVTYTYMKVLGRELKHLRFWFTLII